MEVQNVPTGDQLPALPTGRLWTCPEGERWVVLLSAWLGQWVHWIGHRTQPCLASKCPAQRHKRPAYWMGYMPAAVRGADQPITVTAEAYIPAVVGLSVENCTQIKDTVGLQFPVTVRLVRKPGERVVRILRAISSPAALKHHVPFDVRPTLYRVWGMRPEHHPLPVAERSKDATRPETQEQYNEDGIPFHAAH